MAYSIKYLFKFESAAGTTREIRVLKDGYSGAVIQRPLGRAPMLKKQQNGPVHGTSLEFFAECNVDREFIEFYTSNPKDYRVDLYAGSTLLWQGYITPELYSEPDIAPPYDVQVVATDGVGELKLYDYAAQGTVTLRTLLSGLLSRTGLGTDIYLISSLKPGSAGAGSLLEKTINLDYMAGQTCYEVLTYILDTLHATITWWKGAWILTRETNVTFTNGKVRYFNTAGNSALLNDSVQVLGKMYTNPAWPVGQLSTVIDPAKNKVVVQAPWHPVTCLQNPDMTSDANWTKSNGATYATDGYQMPQSTPTPGITQTLSVPGLRVPMSLRVRATGLTALVGINAIAWLGVVLTYTVGNVTYYLYKDDTGAPVWRPEAGGNLDFEKSLVTWNATEIEAEDLTVENIPAFFQGNSFPAGTLAVNIAGSGIKVYSAYLDVTLPKGYADILRLNNGARGEGDTVEIAIGRETTDNAYYAAFLQGLLLDSGSLITSFSDANFTTGMDYLAFIARDYALSVALPRAKVTGTVFLEGSVQIPPLVFTKGGLDYWVETWGWNLYDDELEISAVTLPSASLTVQSETILESNGSTVSSAGGAGSSGAGSSMGGGGGTNYWEIDGTLNTLLKPKDAYAYVHSKDGLFFTGATLSGTVVPDLYVDVVNNQRVLRSPLPLITGGDQIVIDGTPGGGGGGGGATNLKELEDVYHNASGVRRYSSGNVGNTDLLGYDSTKGWYAVKLGTGLQMTNGELSATGTLSSVSLAAGATNGTLHLVVNGTAQSDVAVTGLGSMAYESSGDYVPIATAKTITATHTFSNGLNLTTSDTWQNVDRALYFSYPEIDSRLSYYNVNSSTGLTYNPATGVLKAGSFVKRGGTSSQFLKADGSVDGSTYLTTGTASSTYVKLSSSAAQIIETTNATDTPLYIKAAAASGCYIGFKKSDDTSWGFIGISNNGLSFATGGQAYKIWNANNDGASSGLDADLLDGQHGSYYAPLSALDNYLPLSAGTSKPLTDSLYIITGDTDKAIQFSYDTTHKAGAAWRIVSNGTGTSDTNYLSFQTGGSSSAATTWNNVLRLSMDNRYVGINMDAPAYQLDVNGTARVTSLKIGSATITWNSNGYLHIDQPLVTAGDQIVISGTPGGGGGGGATTLDGLDDTSISNVSNGQLLQWDTSARQGLGAWVNVATSSVGRIYSAGTGISISNANVISLDGSEYYSATTSRTANTVLAAPNGSNGAASFRALVAADIPSLTKSKISDFPTNVSAFTNDAGYISSYVNTWRNVYTGGTSRVGTGTDTKAINFAAGTGITISYKAAGTGSGQSGSANYFNVEIGVTANTYQPLDADLTAIAAISSGTGLLKRSVSGTTVSWSIDTNTYLTGNQTITLSGDVTGSGTTAITTTIGAGKVTNAMLAGSIANSKLSNSSITINGSSTSLGGSFSTASITAGTAGQSGASTGVSFSIPYVTMNKYGIVTAYGTHTHTISASDLTTTIGGTTYAPYNSAGYLPLSAGSSYPLTWTLFVALNHGIGSPGSSYSMIFQDSSFATYVGEPDSMTIIRTGNNNLFHRKVSTDYVIWDASNSNKSDVAWACSTLTASGNISTSGYVSVGTGGANSYVGSDAANNIFLHNSSGYILVVDGVNVRRGSTATTATLGNSTYPWAGITATSADFRLTNFTDFHIYRNNSVGSAGITYYSAAQTTNYWNVGMDPTGGNYGGRFYWYYTGNYVAYMTTSGSFVTTGDQVVSSDATLKTNLTPVTYSVADIAKARAVEFDWRDGRGHSMGSIAQDWLGIAPALVHGEEGNMSLAYGQLALVNTILLARQSESHEERIARLEKENAELKEEVKRLRMN